MCSNKLSMWLQLTTVVFSVLLSRADALDAVYLPTACGGSTVVTSSVQLESGTGLTYTNNMDCTITFTVAAPYLLLASIGRFELEPQDSGTCNDYVNLHDGADTGSGTLNTDALCGSSLTNTTYVTTGQQITVYFFTDSTAVYLGFNIIFSATTVAPCGLDQSQCNNSYCIDTTLTCDDYNQCGDSSDEDNCTTASSSSGTDWIPLIVGLTLGLLVALLVVAYVIYRRHRLNKWRAFANDHIEQEDLPDPDPSYPVTHKYFRGIRGHPDIHSYAAVSESKERKVAAPVEEEEKTMKA